MSIRYIHTMLGELMLTVVGLIFDIIGFSMMLIFNPTMKMLDVHIKEAVRTGKSVLTINDNYIGKELLLLRIKYIFHKIGIILIIIGFSLQLVATLNTDV